MSRSPLAAPWNGAVAVAVLTFALIGSSCGSSSTEATGQSTSTSPTATEEIVTTSTTGQDDTTSISPLTSTTGESNATTVVGADSTGTSSASTSPTSMSSANAGASNLGLASNGLTIDGAGGGTTFLGFGAAESETVAAVAAVIGQPADRGQAADECPIGPSTYASYHEILLTFVDGNFVGWTLQPDIEPVLTTAEGIGLGSTLSDLRRAYPSLTVDENSSLGVEFLTDDPLFGLLSGADSWSTVLDVWAGETCIYR